MKTLHAQTLNLNVVNKDQFYAKVIFPVINNAYEKHQQEVIETVKK